MTSLRSLLTIVVATLAAGCAQTSGNQCAGWKALYPSAADVRSISQRFNDDVLEHNEYGVKLGCWSAPK